MSLPPFVIPGRHFSRSLAELRNELILQFQGSGPLPLERVFDFIQLTTANESLQRKIIHRGSFEQTASGSWANRGRIINEVMHDIGQQLDRLRLYVPRDVEFEIIENGDTLTLELSTSRILVIFFEPPAPGVGQRFVITSLRIEDTKWRYFGINDDDPTQDIEIVVDLELEPQGFRRPKSDFRGFEKSNVLLKSRPRLASSGQNCTCCNSFQPNRRRPADGPRLVTLHAKIIHQPPRPVEDQVASMNQVFAAADIRVELGSVERLNLPEFLDVDIGRCFRGEVTDEQRRLFTTVRDGVATTHICAYWVRSIGFPTIGCAAHPPNLPSLLMTSFGSQWVLAHEVGHVLGLNHEANQDNLMFARDSITNPPPDLNSNQILVMRSSPWAPLEQQLMAATQ
jgi:hypothetical protein